MKKWILIVVIVGLLGYAVYDFTAKDNAEFGDDVVQNDAVDIDDDAVDEGKVGLKKGETAPDFELETLDGETVSLSDYRGEKVILNFWATWCPPCKAEMPYMQEIHEEYEDVAILAVNSTSTELRGGRDSKKAKGQVKKFIDSEGYTFPVLLDADDEVSMDYSAIFPITGIPTTFIIDKEGTIRYVRPGTFLDKEYIEQFIKLAHE